MINYCPGCGTEIMISEQINSIELVTCESCEHEFSIRDNGQASVRQLNYVRTAIQSRFERSARGFEATGRIMQRAGLNVKMHNPGDGIRPGTPQAGSG